MPFSRQPTGDGSETFFSEAFGEAFHSRHGASQEALIKFVRPCRLPERAATRDCLRVLDICYGLGYNSAAALDAIWAVAPGCRVELQALEIDPQVCRQAAAQNLLAPWRSPVPELLQTLAGELVVSVPQLSARLRLGDARQTLQALQREGFVADAIFLDPFSPPKCPQLWTVEFIALAAACLAPDGYLATYACAAALRTALQQAGLHYGTTLGLGRQSTVASPRREGLPPVSEAEIEHQQTRAAIPYRDPTLQEAPEAILARRQREQATCGLEPTTQWRKRWRARLEGERPLL